MLKFMINEKKENPFEYYLDSILHELFLVYCSIVSGKWRFNVLNTYHVRERILIIKVKAQADLYIIQVCFPTSSSTEEELDDMYKQLEELMRLTETKSNVFIMGDFNASVGNQTSERGCVGKFDLGSINQRGAKLIKFCEQFQLNIINTMLSEPKRRRYIWKVSGDTARY